MVVEALSQEKQSRNERLSPSPSPEWYPFNSVGILFLCDWTLFFHFSEGKLEPIFFSLKLESCLPLGPGGASLMTSWLVTHCPFFSPSVPTVEENKLYSVKETSRDQVRKTSLPVKRLKGGKNLHGNSSSSNAHVRCGKMGNVGRWRVIGKLS